MERKRRKKKEERDRKVGGFALREDEWKIRKKFVWDNIWLRK